MRIIESLDAKVEKIIAKYEDKDYWDDEMMIENKIKEWESFGSPEKVNGISGKCTAEAIRDAYNKQLKTQRQQWVEGLVAKINRKDETELKNLVRGDQTFTKEVFTAVTGLETKGMSGVKLAPVIKEWCNS
jgi:hypothetical protein